MLCVICDINDNIDEQSMLMMYVGYAPRMFKY